MFGALAVGFAVGIILGVLLGLFVVRSSAPRRRRTAAGHTGKAAKDDVKMVLLVRNDLGMQKGKIAAQCGHAVLGAYHAAVRQSSPCLEIWEASGGKKIALKVSSEEELCDFGSRATAHDVVHYIVRDAGHTQVAPHTRTVCALGPAPTEVLDALGCKDLKLL
eukprot:TRINITY_DN100600_c0_g1_i1.p1 TRINITY_DN100600_c0_g1~~TRINITY_DN100600_c0_g1_i1.p1  ORF type:complete len:163 (-),score=29.51 TRINITY_DN100600_c0_g1_i1:77-565(-)